MELPTRAFYEQDRRAALLRNLCLAAVDAAVDLIRSEQDRPDNLATLFWTNRMLGSLGVAPDMHMIEYDDPDRPAKEQHMATNPIVAAEFLGGQVLSSVGDIRAGAEHTKPVSFRGQWGDAAPTYDVRFGAVGPDTAQLLKDVEVLGGMWHFLDPTAGPTQDFREIGQ